MIDPEHSPAHIPVQATVHAKASGTRPPPHQHRKTGGGAPATILFTSPDASENMAPALAVLRESAPRPPPQDVMTAAGFWGVQLILGDVRDVVPHGGYDCPTPTPIIIMRNWCEALGVPIVSVEY
ncbi:hypothetical protein HDU90_003418 [Geranomyces variabilis]|nr:hypothetical protein HDU90_003418 [Geranomyces variabilis]